MRIKRVASVYMSSVRDYLSTAPVMFVTDIARGHSRRQPTRTVSSSFQSTVVAAPTTSLYDKIRLKKEALQKEQASVPKRKADLQTLREERDSLTARHQIKRRRELDRIIEEKEQEIQRIESGETLQEFADKVEPYVRAHQKQQFCRPVPGTDEGAAPQSDAAAHKEPLLAAEEYAVAIEGAAPRYDIETRDMCRVCGEPAQLNTTLSILVCVKCGATQPFLDATAALLAYSDDGYDYASFSYKRINHFVEWMASMQAKEATDIPQSVIDAVMQRLYEERVTCAKEVTGHKVRAVLKALRLRKYYEHTQLIASKITGQPPPRLTPAQEEKIKLMFMAASNSFQRLCPPDRANFISYSFALLKIVTLLGYDEFIPLFSPFKSKEKWTRADTIWKDIAADLDWTYIPSVPQ